MSSRQPTGNPRVSLTGYATASAWAYYGFAGAEAFDSWRGRALFLPLRWASAGLRPLAPAAADFPLSLYWRHRWFSAWATARAPRLAVEIGAGLSTRGIAHAASDPGCRWVDYDLPAMARARARRLAHRELPANYRLAAGDLLDPALGAELAAPAAPASAIVLTEGVIDYLDHAEKRRAFEQVAGLLARLGGGRYLFEIYPRDRLARFGAATGWLLGCLRTISGRDLRAQLFASADESLEYLRAAGFARARLLPEAELDAAERAPAPERRAFVLVEAEVDPV